ncbi:hypothetical protein F9K97_05555 [Brucella anthropi]|uniref:hypothetical protein n=1 Tax=Brucella anthropi TaxID=529 RepID=UPI00124DB69C|nr:hypothetical protein [Brucella anthropi]KAB2788547.1 hypothetical protein F9K97_05555 [Brucella anthropi]
MTENAEIPHKKTKKSITIWVLSAISLAYIGIVYLLIIKTETCDGVGISANWFKGFWDQYLGCRSVNELGDTLAGAFAPVAFLWLMGAVFIQSQELKAQREELDETQEVMRAQLTVSIQQVEETKASTELFRKQTEILEKEQALREQKEADLEFDAKAAVAMEICRDIQRLNILLARTTKEETTVQTLAAQHSMIFDFGERRVENFRDLLKLIHDNSIRAAETVHFTPVQNGFHWEWSDNFAAKSILDFLKQLSEDHKPLSSAYAFKKEAMGIDTAYWKFRELQSLMSQKNIANALINNAPKAG